MGWGGDFERYDALGLAALVRSGDVTPGDLLDEALVRLDERDGEFNSVIHRMEGEARRVIAEDLPGDGGLRGVPFLLKDLGANYRGEPTSGGSRFFAGTDAPDHSDIVARYRRAGLVIFGKTNTPELGANMTTEPRLFGPTRNPWDPALSPGGSSGGSAAAVAAGIVPSAHASDGGGSIRIPASCCGLFGLKPSRGRSPFGPARGEGPGALSQQHAVTRSVRDSAALLDVISGPDPGAPYRAPEPARPFREEVAEPPGRLRIGVSRTAPDGHRLHPDCVKALDEAASLCEDLGHAVDEAAPAWDEDAMDDAYRTVVDAGLATAVAERARGLGRPPDPGDDLEAGIAVRVEAGRATAAPDYLCAITTLHRTGRQVARFFGRHDLWLTPTLATPPPPLGTFDANDSDVAGLRAALTAFSPFTRLANVTGLPAMSVPLHWSAARLPIGVHFMGRWGAEPTLIRLAAQLETARPWWHLRPPR